MASLPRIATLIKASASLFLVILLLNSSSCTEAENVLYPGEVLRSGEFLTHGSNSILRMQIDCNLVLYDLDIPVWHANTARPDQNCSCTVLIDGELVVRNSNGTIIWRSRVTGIDGDYALVLQPNGKFVIYGPVLWYAPNKTNIAQVAAA